MTTELWRYDAVGVAELIRTRAVSAREAVAAAIERAESLGGEINAIVHPRFDAALADAARLDDSADTTRGPFAGVPFAIKDYTCTEAGEPNTWGMRAFVEIDRRATETSVLVERYRRAGVISLGRTNLPELALGPPTTEPDAHGPCRNPWNLDLSVGGSSGGSAAAVAAGIVPIAHASDGGGSLRIPAACTGLVGLKVSRGRITNAPRPDGRGTAVQGHLARTVRDVAALLDATAGALPGEPFACPPPPIPWSEAITRPPRSLRVGLLDRAPRAMDPVGDCGAANRSAVARAGALLEGLGHEVEHGHPVGLDQPMQTPHLYAADRSALRRTIEAELGRPLTAADVEPRTWALFEAAANVDGPTVLAEIGLEQQWSRAVSSWWRSDDNPDGWDLLVTPALGRGVPRIGELKEHADDPLGRMLAGLPMAWFTYPFNSTGHPALVIPLGDTVPSPTRDVPPIAVQLVAAHGREDLLLAVAATIEPIVGWAEPGGRPGRLG